MLLNSLDFAVFLPVVFVLHWFVLNDDIRIQSVLIAIATTLAWIFFRSPTLSHALVYIRTVFSASLFEAPAVISYATQLFITFFVAIEWIRRKEQYAIACLGLTWKRGPRPTFYYALFLVIYFFAGTPQEFIHFQF